MAGDNSAYAEESIKKPMRNAWVFTFMFCFLMLSKEHYLHILKH